MPTYNDSRIRKANENAVRKGGDYVLYWMQAFRRFDRNHALDYALHQCKQLGKPLVVFEGLRMDYPWANDRHHMFMLQGMADNAIRAKALGLNYWPFVETPDQPAKGLLKKLAAKACVVVTDDYPAFVVPGHIRGLAKQTDTAVVAVDGNGLVPLSLLGPSVVMNAHLRPRVHLQMKEAWGHRAAAEPDFSQAAKGKIDPPFEPWRAKDIFAFIASLPIDHKVKPAPVAGGHAAGQAVLATFLKTKLKRYGEGRNAPDDPAESAASGLSPYLRHGHLSIQQVAEEVLGPKWTVEKIDMSCKGKREGFYGPDANANSFLDEAITWRDLGYHWHYHRMDRIRPINDTSKAARELRWTHPVYQDLDSTLPPWALATLRKHEFDAREHLYSLEEFDAADTHDDLWNAAQTELKETGRIHNYLRMLWGKKVLEWTKTPDEAYFILEHLNNKYAIDGRDPNSYTGMLWCFGLFDRPWPPERPVFGNIRYMSSGNTAKKFKLDGYYAYVKRLQGKRDGLFE